MSDEESNFLNLLTLSDSEDEAKTQAQDSRTALSEESFTKLKKSYVPRIENGQLWTKIKLPLPPGPVSKFVAQDIIHAIEELYFLRRFEEALGFTVAVLGDAGGRIGGVDGITLVRYRDRCLRMVG